MAAFVYFTVADTYQAIVSDGSDDGNEPDLKMISGTVTFTPSVKEVLATISDIPTTVRLEPIIGRIEEDGVLKTLDSTPGVKLLANTEAIAAARADVSGGLHERGLQPQDQSAHRTLPVRRRHKRHHAALVFG